MLVLLFVPAFGQATGVDRDNKGIDQMAQGKYDEATNAYDNASEISSQAFIYKAGAEKVHGSAAASNSYYAMADWHDDPALINASVLDHCMATSVDESAGTVSSRTQEFSANDSKAYSWLSLGNVGAGTVYWNWYSPAGQILYMDSV
jgi:hypothetical protein